MAYADGSTTVGGMISAGFGVMQRQAASVGAYALVSVLQQVIQHMEKTAMIGGPAGSGLVTLVVIIAGFIIHTLILRNILLHERLMTENTPLLWGTYIGVSIVVALGVALGMVLLVVPGLMLLTRWFLAPYFVLARGTDVGASLAASRDATSGHRWGIFAVLWVMGLIYLACLGPIILAAGGYRGFTGLVWYSGLGLLALLVQAIIVVVNLSIGVGIFATLADHANTYDDVFA